MENVAVINLKGVKLYYNDIPEDFPRTKSVAIDTEAMGLMSGRDRLCLVQLSCGDGTACLVQVNKNPAPRLAALLADRSVLKIFHFARFDVAILYRTFGVMCMNIYCTKIASKLCRTYTERHGLLELCRELLGISLSKSEQSSDWGAFQLTDSQKHYAASDVLYLHSLKTKLDVMLEREGRTNLCRRACMFLPTRILLDEAGFPNDIFEH